MLDALVAVGQVAALGFVLWGGWLCIGGGERRKSQRAEHPRRRRSDIQPGALMPLAGR